MSGFKRGRDSNDRMSKNIKMVHLIAYGIYSVIDKGEECTFERLVKECFTLFPKVFGFQRYQEWPDSLKFDRPLRTLRQKGLIVGNPKTSFSLTKFGETIAEETKTALKIGIPVAQLSHITSRGTDANLIAFLKGNEIFKNFLKDKKKLTLTEMEIRNLLRCTLETPARVLKQNLQYSRRLAEEFKEKELLEFLELCERTLNKKRGSHGV